MKLVITLGDNTANEPKTILIHTIKPDIFTTTTCFNFMRMFATHRCFLSPTRRSLLLAFLAGGVFLSGGCGKKPDVSTSIEQNSNAIALPVVAEIPRAGNAPRVMPVTVVADVDVSAQLAQMTQILRRFSAERQRVPQALSELTAAGYLAALPMAPAGKQFVIDAKRVEVLAVNK